MKPEGHIAHCGSFLLDTPARIPACFAAVSNLEQRVMVILGVDSPFFSAIALFKNQPFPHGFRWFSRKTRIPGKNGEATPRSMPTTPSETALPCRPPIPAALAFPSLPLSKTHWQSERMGGGEASASGGWLPRGPGSWVGVWVRLLKSRVGMEGWARVSRVAPKWVTLVSGNKS